MRAVLLVMAMLLFAGCIQQAPAPAEATFQVRILIPTGSYYVGDEVPIGLQATATPERISWAMGDGTSLVNVTSVSHRYEDVGTFHIQVRALANGQIAEAHANVTVQEMFIDVAPVPLPSVDDPSIVRVAVQQEPTVGGPVTLRLLGPSLINGSGQLRIITDTTIEEVAFDALPGVVEVPTDSPGRKAWPWAASINGQSFSGTVVFDVWGEPIVFGEPTTEQWLRPGAQTVHNGAQCTVNFLYHYKWYRFFVGSAAHCVDGVDINEVCSAGSDAKIGSQPTVSAHDGRSVKTTLVYHSWLTMESRGGGVCPSNDFALYELGPKAQAVMHPAGLGLGGPTGMAPADGYGLGTTLYGYGASQLHGNVGVAYPGQDDVNSKRGASLGASGFYQDMYFAIPGIPGDSGGPAYGPGGEALGAASVIYTRPLAGSNAYTIVPKALAYMQEAEGWAPELVTWDRFETT